MAPAYTPVSTDEEAAGQNSQKRAPTWLKALWIIQGAFSFMEILGVPMVIMILFMQFSGLVLVFGLMYVLQLQTSSDPRCDETALTV